MPTIRIELPHHLRQLAAIPGHELALDVTAAATVTATLDALEARFPQLRGTIRDRDTLVRRPFLRFFACETDLTHDSPDSLLPEAVLTGKECLIILGAIAGG